MSSTPLYLPSQQEEGLCGGVRSGLTLHNGVLHLAAESPSVESGAAKHHKSRALASTAGNVIGGRIGEHFVRHKNPEWLAERSAVFDELAAGYKAALAGMCSHGCSQVYSVRLAG